MNQKARNFGLLQYCGIRLEDREKIMNWTTITIFCARDSKPEYPEYEVQVSNKQLWCSVYIVRETEKTQVSRTQCCNRPQKEYVETLLR